MAKPRKRTSKGLRRYVLKVAEAMGIYGWSFYIKDDKGEEWGNMAEITVQIAYKTASLEVRDDWKRWSPEELRSTIVHELVHTWTNSAFYTVLDVEGIISEDASAILTKACGQWIEYATESACQCIAPHMPLY